MPEKHSSLHLHWYLPTYGDSRNITRGGHGTSLPQGSRTADLDYLTQLSLAAEHNHFESVLVPTGMWCEDAWITTAALISRTTTLKFLVALRPGLVSPLVLAQQALAFQRLSGNRLNLNVVVGGEDHEQRAFGDYSTKDERYANADETLTILRHLFTSDGPLDFDGQFQRTEGAVLRRRPDSPPPIFFGGSSQAGIAVAAKHADVYLTWGEPPKQVEEKLKRVRAQATAAGRAVAYGIRLHVIARETEDEAWRIAQQLLDALDPDEVRRLPAGLARSQSEGQRRQSQLHRLGADFAAGTSARALEIHPNLWAGVGLVRGGAGTALVGSYRQVAERIQEYARLGLSHFILSGYPHLEETYHVGEGVLPALRDLGLDIAGEQKGQSR